MKKVYILIVNIFFSFSATLFSQSTEGDIQNKAFDKTVNKLLSYSVPTMSVKDLYDNFNDYTLLDAREKREFDVSHIKGAKYLGYDEWDESSLEGLDKDLPIVIYCSIGYRSEKMGEKLKELGFSEVYNLYGSIFEWVNQGYPIVNGEQESTTKVHGYNWLWARWIDNDNYEKVY